MRLSTWAGCLIAAFATASSAQEAKAPPSEQPKPPPFTFEVHGFVSGTLFLQDAALRPSEGGLALWVAPQTGSTSAGNIGGKQPGTDRLVLSGDIRQTRLAFGITGPSVLGGKPKGVVEFDMFGGYGGGITADTSPIPRVRLGYVELNLGKHRFVVGQNHDLLIAQMPISLAHLGNPIGFVAGMQGWRRPGVFGYHTLGDRKDLYAELAWEVGRAGWDNSSAVNVSSSPSGKSDRFGFQYGEASGLPAVEARAVIGKGTQYAAFAVAHWNRADRSGADATSGQGNGVKDLDVFCGQAGARATIGPVTLLVEGFSGKNLGPIMGAFTQIQANGIGDVHEYGGYAQAGFNFTKELSLFGFIGTDKIDGDDAVAANFAVLQNTVTSFLLQYRNAGYAVGLEYEHYVTQTRDPGSPTAARNPALDGRQDGNKLSFNAVYFF